jgi:hypothetical protein
MQMQEDPDATQRQLGGMSNVVGHERDITYSTRSVEGVSTKGGFTVSMAKRIVDKFETSDFRATLCSA